MSTSPREEVAVSVLVTAYNREKYLAECLESIIASSFTDFEVIVVDDRSADGTEKVADHFASSDSRVRVFRNDTNLGDYGNRNRAASLARGKYLKYVDADDVLYKFSLDIMVSAMEQFPDAALGLSWSVIDPDFPFPFVSTPREAYRAHYLGVSFLGMGPSASIIRRDAFEKVDGFSGRQFIGDSELWLSLIEIASLVSLPPGLVWWRRHPGQQMTLELADPDVLAIRNQLEREKLAATKWLTDDEKRQAAKRLNARYSRQLLRKAVLDHDIGAARHFLAAATSAIVSGRKAR